MSRSGCAWRYLPKEFPPWQTVYGYYASWQAQGVLKKTHHCLVTQVRLSENRPASPSMLIVDSQSSKAHWGEDRGFDGFKKVRGRKRSIFVDTLGLIHSVHVDSAEKKDHVSAVNLFEEGRISKDAHQRISAFYADGGYRPHDFQNAVKKNLGIWPTFNVTASKRDGKNSKQILESNLKPKRWIVERTFAWFNHYRRLSRDYERRTPNSETMIYVAMTQLMLKRLSRSKSNYARWQ